MCICCSILIVCIRRYRLRKLKTLGQNKVSATIDDSTPAIESLEIESLPSQTYFYKQKTDEMRDQLAYEKQLLAGKSVAEKKRLLIDL